MARLQVVTLPNDQFGLVLDEIADPPDLFSGLKATDVGARFILVFETRVDVDQ